MDILDKIGQLVRDPAVQVDLWGFIFALVVSAFVGLVASALYQIFYENRATGAQVHRSFLLMAPSITALVYCHSIFTSAFLGITRGAIGHSVQDPNQGARRGWVYHAADCRGSSMCHLPIYVALGVVYRGCGPSPGTKVSATGFSIKAKGWDDIGDT